MTKQEQIQKHECLWRTLIVLPKVRTNAGTIVIADVPGEVNKIVNRIFANREIYQSVSSTFANPIRWYHVAVIHYMECTLNFNCYLGNGQPYNKRTTIIPIGRGPFFSFQAGAIDAIKLQGLDKEQDWSIGNTLYILEGFNGYGYTQYHNMNSPYLYSGSNHYLSGKYVADGVFNKSAVSSQIGAALLLKEILNRLAV